jgi:alanine racemase
VLFDPDPDEVSKYHLIPVISDLRSAERLSAMARAKEIKHPVHIKVDTGMGRLGITSDAEKKICDIASLQGITVEGLMSHLSESESPDHEFSLRQIEFLRDLRERLEQRGLTIPYCHMANSGGILGLPDSHFDAVRPGLMLYGYGPGIKRGSAEDRKCGSQNPEAEAGRTETREHGSEKLELRPVMKLTTRIVSLRKIAAGSPVSYNRTFITKRDSLIAAVSLGYADGYSVAFSSNSEMLVKGRRVPVIGRVCMDISMIDLTDIDGVNEEDEVVVIGQQSGECITAADLASRAGTHAYEILTSLGSRARRVYSAQKSGG